MAAASCALTVDTAACRCASSACEPGICPAIPPRLAAARWPAARAASCSWAAGARRHRRWPGNGCSGLRLALRCGLRRFTASVRGLLRPGRHVVGRPHLQSASEGPVFPAACSAASSTEPPALAAPLLRGVSGPAPNQSGRVVVLCPAGVPRPSMSKRQPRSTEPWGREIRGRPAHHLFSWAALSGPSSEPPGRSINLVAPRLALAVGQLLLSSIWTLHFGSRRVSIRAPAARHHVGDHVVSCATAVLSS